jgi:hypothetical protein
MNEYLDKDDEQRDDKRSEIKPAPENSSQQQKKGNLETEGPDKDKAGKVLHKDGSLANDLPGKDGAGSGALEGTVGLGT